PRRRRDPLHALQPGLVRDGAARGHERGAAGGCKPPARFLAGHARRRRRPHGGPSGRRIRVRAGARRAARRSGAGRGDGRRRAGAGDRHVRRAGRGRPAGGAVRRPAGRRAPAGARRDGVRSKYSAWAACGGLAAGAVGLAAARSRRAALATAVVAGGWLYGTFDPRSRLFGAPVEVRPEPGAFALTFDDGPDPRHTEGIAGLPRDRGPRAPFFALGRAVRAHPGVAVATAAAGHELASHGDDHRLLALTPPSGIRAQLRAAEAAVQDATGSLPAP